MTVQISDELQNAFQGVIPPVIATSSADGAPNITYISTVRYIDDNHLALSWQFLNKTWKNILENPRFIICVTCPDTGKLWQLKLRYLETQTSGELFDEMSMTIEVIASMMGTTGIFKLAAAVICRVEAVEVMYDGNNR
jgi:predicted pyridoxine 5'-phosphate oxidase superfamily flavin-nucleotide-binding protein